MSKVSRLAIELDPNTKTVEHNVVINHAIGLVRLSQQSVAVAVSRRRQKRTSTSTALCVQPRLVSGSHPALRSKGALMEGGRMVESSVSKRLAVGGWGLA